MKLSVIFLISLNKSNKRSKSSIRYPVIKLCNDKVFRGELKVPNIMMIKFYEEQVHFNNKCLFSKRKILYGKLM